MRSLLFFLIFSLVLTNMAGAAKLCCFKQANLASQSVSMMPCHDEAEQKGPQASELAQCQCQACYQFGSFLEHSFIVSPITQHLQESILVSMPLLESEPIYYPPR